MHRPTIAIDHDGVLADIYTPWTARYNRDWGDNLTPAKITTWGIHDLVKPECGTKIYDYLKDPDLYDEAPIYPGAAEAIELLLSHDFKLCVPTIAWENDPVMIAGKLRWNQRELPHLPGTAYMFLQDKAFVRADALADDNPRNLESFIGFRALIDAPHNRMAMGFTRYSNVLEFAKAMVRMYVTEPATV